MGIGPINRVAVLSRHNTGVSRRGRCKWYRQEDGWRISWNKKSSRDEIANVNFFYDDVVHVEASAYAHW